MDEAETVETVQRLAGLAPEERAVALAQVVEELESRIEATGKRSDSDEDPGDRSR